MLRLVGYVIYVRYVVNNYELKTIARPTVDPTVDQTVIYRLINDFTAWSTAW